MRLIDRAFVQQHYLSRVRRLRTNPVTLEFMEYTSSTKPRMQVYLQTVVKYDMLSHRWLLEGEPSFKDMTDGTAASTAGYQ
ncbi:hypothetical protein QC761_205625 [Podospora bellae-mahoneyi]|uniref:Uncharacterized protein n=1 Tax=Podospora bellae-mahoneyi TaxID=2093777 RepID=A0ABR0FPJ6_9PEZI|nr:hypothetical protein QC761_205625 [Podospora bellae-mahoneyi]